MAKNNESCANIQPTLCSFHDENSQRVCMIPLTARLQSATEARKVCVLR